MSFNPPIPGSTTIIAKLELRNNPDLPVADMQHIEGGAWSQATLSDRDAIPATLRQANITRCYVVATDITYVLRNGIDNINWQPEGAMHVDQLTKLIDDQALVIGTAFSLVLPVDLFGTTPVLQIVHVSNLPPGLVFDGQHTVSGNPTKAGTYITVVDYINPVTNRLVQYTLVFTAVSGVADSGLKLQNFIGIALQCQQGLAWSYDVPQDLFLSTTGHAVSVFAVDGLPDGLTYSAVTKKITGTSTEYGRFAIILQHTDSFGGAGQYVFSLWVHVAVPTSVVAATVGAANIDVVFNPIADDPFATGNAVHLDYDLAWQLTQSDLAEFGQRAIPGSADTRFIGAKNIPGAIAIAALGSSIGSTTQQRFYRFAVSLAVLRTLYPAKVTVTFGLYGKRKSTNLSASAALNKISAVTINRTKTSGIIAQAAGNNVDFKTNGDALAPFTDSTGWLVGTVETLLLTATVNLSTGELTLGTPAPAANQPPTVANPAPDYTGTVGIVFNQVLSASEFADADGSIVSAVATGLPPGLVYNFPQHNLTGTPTTAGTYSVIITATDDQGATVQDPLVITIAPPANVAPIVANPAPDYTGTVGTAFSQILPNPEFTDPDGSIVSAVASGLPPGLSYSFSAHSITGTPTTQGTYNVTITATDNNGSTVGDPLVIVIGAHVNQPPVVANHVPNQTGTVNDPFELFLPLNEFSDPDGTIVSRSITGFPPGVTNYNNATRRIWGTPTTAGTYTLQVTGFDDQGASVIDSFNIVIAPAPSGSVYQPDGNDFYTV